MTIANNPAAGGAPAGGTPPAPAPGGTPAGGAPAGGTPPAPAPGGTPASDDVKALAAEVALLKAEKAEREKTAAEKAAALEAESKAKMTEAELAKAELAELKQKHSGLDNQLRDASRREHAAKLGVIEKYWDVIPADIDTRTDAGKVALEKWAADRNELLAPRGGELPPIAPQPKGVLAEIIAGTKQNKYLPDSLLNRWLGR